MNVGPSPASASASDVIEQRLAAATQAVRERDLCTQQHRQQSAREQTAAAEAAAARKEYAGAEQGVERLEHLSLVRVLAALHGAREDALAREKAEAQAARYRCAEAQQRLDGVRAELARLEGQLAELAEAGRAYADALAAKERYLTTSADPRGVRLLALVEERGRLAAELRELRRAAEDADAAGVALAEVRDRLGTAANWSAFDTYFDHGIVANAINHDRIDQAAQAAREAISGWRRSAPIWPNSADLSPPRPGSRSGRASGSPTSSLTTSSPTWRSAATFAKRRTTSSDRPSRSARCGTASRIRSTG